MGIGVATPIMLAGLLGVGLPVLVHLLSRRKFDVVDWGAMQFLELSQKTRRRMRLEELLLMLLRMALIALVVLALAEPWISGGIFSNLRSSQSRDVVLVIDGSYSMGWEGDVETPQAAAVKWAHGFLETLNPGDTVSIVDARDVPREVLDPPVQDFNRARETLDTLPSPSGSSDLPAAMIKAVQILSRTSNLAREIVVLTDRQKVPWAAGDESLWRRFDDLVEQPTQKPRVWVVDVSSQPGEKENFAVGNIKLSRDLTVPNFPTRIQAVVRSFGAKQKNRRVHLEVNGQRITERTISRTVPANGETTVEFDNIKLPTTGSWLISVAIDSDQLPGDNRADAAISVADAIPVIIIDGDWSGDPTQRESFFAKTALSSSGNKQPWVLSKAVQSATFQPADPKSAQVAIIANVAQLNEPQVSALKDFVNRGGGLFLCAGSRVDAENWNRLLYEEGTSLLPFRLDNIQRDENPDLGGVRIREQSLTLPWVMQFKRPNGGDLVDTFFSQWWRTTVAPRQDNPDKPQADRINASDPTVVMKLTTGDPLLVGRQFGKGRVLAMAAPVDADWGRLPARQDFVPFLHEVVFYLASAEVDRNVSVGAPLIQPITNPDEVGSYVFIGPEDIEFEAEPGGDELRPAIQLSDTRLAGVYQLKPQGDKAGTRQYFVVNGDRAESDLTPLDEPAVDALQADQRMQFINEIDELTRQMYDEESPTAIWKPLLVIFILFLVGELLLTRRLVKGGHAPQQPAEPASHSQAAEAVAVEPDEIDDFVDSDPYSEEQDLFEEIEAL